MTTFQTLLAGLRFPISRAPTESASLLSAIHALKANVSDLDDDQLVAESKRLRDQTVDNGGGLIEIPKVFALASEAAYRSIGIRFYDVQVMAARSLLNCQIAEMKTGEGKTYVGALTSYAWSLMGRGVHFMTTNDYLAERDCDLVRPMLERLGVSVGFLSRESDPVQKRNAYLCDITYGPGYEFGFDYLRDQLALIQHRQPNLGEHYRTLRRGDEESEVFQIQREHFSAIVDEADSVMIDEATTPLVLSGSPGQPSEHPEPYQVAAEVARNLRSEDHFSLDSRTRRAELTKAGISEIEQHLDQKTLQHLRRPWFMYVQHALQARHHFTRDADYVAADDKIKIVDANTGRIFEDRTWSDGLHQAVEAKERVTITDENRSLARISRQQFFRLYENLCGMTGTALDSEAELSSVYKLPVTVIPTHKDCRRVVYPMRVFADENSKYDAIGRAVREMHETSRPILIGTRTIEKSELVAQRLSDLPVQILNGKQDADEARMVAGAGTRGAIMVATNMAGRGTDIKLGEGVNELGGLHVIVCEPHDSARVDRQLVGRASRQGDPGSCQTFVSADDDVIQQYARWMARYIRRIAGPDGEVEADLSRELAKLQNSVERKSAAKRREMFSRETWLEDVLSTLAKQ